MHEVTAPQNTGTRRFTKYLGRLTTMAAASALVIGLSACSTIDESEGNAAAVGPKELTEIGFDYPFTMLPIYGRLTGYAQDLADQEGIKLSLSNDQGQLERQISNLTAWQAQGMPAIVSFPLESASAERIAKSHITEGGIWITYGGTMENQSGSINFSDYDRGKALAEHAADWAEENLDGTGKAAFLIDESIELGRNRTAGLRENFEKNAPGVEVVAEETATGAEAGLSAANAIISQHPDINLILSISDDTGIGVYQALVESGRAKDDAKTYVGGMDGNEIVLNYIKDKSIYRGSAALSVKENGEAVVEAAKLASEGQDAEVNVPVVMLDAASPELDRFIAEHGGK